ncbi:MAG: T9SS type A sorting domain-containing protein, partial [Bacteroidales bacterium]|nr:T9SS type A sorting domain-containing protein [Bacteroidales bacterium]
NGDKGQAVIRNMQGQIVKTINLTGKETEISVSNLHSGEYMLQIIENGNVTTKKIIIH